MSRKLEILAGLEELISNRPVEKIEQEVKALKEQYYQAFDEEVALARESWEQNKSEEDEEEGFRPPQDETREQFKGLLDTYHQKLQEYEAQKAAEEAENLTIKQGLIETLKKLISEEENIGLSFQKFREILDKWKETGHVPYQEAKEIQSEFSRQIELFNAKMNLFKEFQEYDLKKNLEQKQEIIRKAKELSKETSIKKLQDMMKVLHHEWNETGPVSNDLWEDLKEQFWGAIRSADEKIRAHYEEIREKLEEALKAQIELAEQAVMLRDGKFTSHKAFLEATEQLIALQKAWKSTGQAPRKEGEIVWDIFRNACDAFFEAKSRFYDNQKALNSLHKQQKKELIKQADAVKNSKDWKTTTELLIGLQKKWKEIGAVPRKEEQKLWEQFRQACDVFFNSKKEFFSTIDEIRLENQKKKEAILDRAKNLSLTGNTKEDSETLRNLNEEWHSIDQVPRAERDRLNNAFREALDKLYDQLKLDKNQKLAERYSAKIQSLTNSDNSRDAIRNELRTIEDSIRKLEEEVRQYENNIGFFRNSKNASPLIKEVEKKMDMAQKSIADYKFKLRLLKEQSRAQQQSSEKPEN